MSLSVVALQQKLAKQRWTAHNIQLTPELMTIPGTPDFVRTDRRLHAILRLISVLYRSKSLTGLRVADLGCLEGGFAFGMARLGASALGIDARRANIEKALLLKEHFDLPDLDFSVGDVKEFNLQKFGRFDAVLALGILYHLDNPVQWLAQVAETVVGAFVVETHYAPDSDAALASVDGELRRALGEIETFELNGESWRGRRYVEYPEGRDPEDLLWSAYSNSSSLWLTRESLLRAMLRAGFDLVLEQHDYTAPQYDRFTKSWPRGLFVGVRSAFFAR